MSSPQAGDYYSMHCVSRLKQHLDAVIVSQSVGIAFSPHNVLSLKAPILLKEDKAHFKPQRQIVKNGMWIDTESSKTQKMCESVAGGLNCLPNKYDSDNVLVARS